MTKMKLPRPGALEKIKSSMDKLVHQPVSKKLVNALIKAGEIERTKANKDKATRKSDI